ncbi:MAG: DUF1552 domain-containing protein [Myxococcaceae bacterium]|jgi:hypothetical protein|nr:DUF1552 domain-containing protein [Myxococcaceae bacterium]
MTSRFDRREALKLGVAGLFGAHLVGLRAYAQGQATPPRRVVLFYAPEGINWRFWLSRSLNEGANVGRSGEAPLRTLLTDVYHPASNLWPVFTERYGDASRATVENLIDEVNVIDGVCNAAGAGDEESVDSHHYGMMGFKAGVYAREEQRAVTFGGYNTTIEHLIARAWFAQGKPASVIDNVLNVRLFDSGYLGQGGTHYRGWLGLGGTSADVLASSSSPGGVLEPSRLWDRLFNGFTPGGASGPSPASLELRRRYERMQRRNAITADEVAQVKRRLGRDEAATLDSYLTSLRAAELRMADQVALAERPMPNQCQVPGRPTQTFSRAQYRELTRQVAEQLALAMACDRVRMVNLLNWGTNPQGITIRPGFSGNWHDEVGHTDHNTGDAFFVRRYQLHCDMFRAFCELLAALKRIPEGNGTVLDSTTVLVVSEHSGEHHSVRRPHFALMAGGGGRNPDGSRVARTGRYLKLATTKTGTSFSNLRTANDLCITLAHQAGVTRAFNTSNVLADFTRFGHPSFTSGPITLPP